MCTDRTVLTDRLSFDNIYRYLSPYTKHPVFRNNSFFRYRDVIGVTVAGSPCPFDKDGRCIIFKKEVRPLACQESDQC